MASEDLLDIDDKRRLELGLSLRETMIRNLTKEGALPSNPKDRYFLLKVMETMDTTILSKAKLKSDDNGQRLQESIAKSLSEILTKTSIAVPNSQRETPFVSHDYKVNDMVPGETDQGTSTLNYETFTKPT
jgi:hypothetical protein